MDKRNEKVITIIVCVLLSFSLWVYISNVENVNRTVELKNISVTIENESALSESKLVLLPDQVFEVNLRIEGPSKKVYSISKQDFNLKVDLSAYALKSGVNNIPVKIVDYPEGINIKNTGNLIIKVVLENLEEKEINITSKVNTTFQDGISEVSSEISPQKVTISGASSLIDKVSQVIIDGSESNISRNFSRTFNLKAVDANGDEVDGVEISTKKVTYSMKVKKQKEVPIKVDYQGSLPNGISKEFEELSINNIIISGEVDDVDKIESIKTEPIYLSNITENKKITLDLVIPEVINVVGNDTSVILTYNVKNNNTVQEVTDDEEQITKTIEGVEVSYIDEDTTKYDYEYVTKTVNIDIKGTKADLDNITKDQIKVEASVKDLTTEGENSVDWNASFINTLNNVSIVNNTGSVVVKVTLKE
ncbi:MAG: CdaR family protein [Clostridium sp.]|nr:CdaR family protein [Clostridium sp.]